VITAVVATAVAAQPMKMMGTRTMRAVPRSRMLARIAMYSSFCTEILDTPEQVRTWRSASRYRP
jgi:hypothetical protein